MIEKIRLLFFSVKELIYAIIKQINKSGFVWMLLLSERWNKMSEYRITKNVFEKDVEEIFDNLKEYNLSKLEYSEIVPIGIFKEDKDGKI